MNVSALDENGRPVDWWFMYKVPKLHAGNGGDAATGYEYVYYDATIDKEGGPVAASQHTIDSGKGALNETLNAVFGCKDPSLGWILYNDETPDAAKITDDGNLGHTKGVIAFRLGLGELRLGVQQPPRRLALDVERDHTLGVAKVAVVSDLGHTKGVIAF